jgi:hypothetical protein
VIELADLLPPAARECVGALGPYADRDWRAGLAAELDWSAWDTVLHIADCLQFYAAQVILARTDDYICIELKADDHATPARLLDAVEVSAELLRRTVLAADPATRSYHTYSVSDPEGFAAMGLVELTIHTYDLMRGFDPDRDWRPPADAAAAVLDRLFPGSPPGDPVDVLLYRCGRSTLGDRPRLTEWRWDGRPRAEQG